MLKAVLFDFDGTLANTYPIIFKAFKEIFKIYKNIDITDQEIVDLFGPAEEEIIYQAFSDHHNHAEIIKHYYHVYNRDHALKSAPLLELNEFLAKLVKEEIALGIITGKGRKSLDISLAHLFQDIAFDITIAGDEVQNPKPHPEALHKAMQQLNIQAKETVFVGDSNFDIQAGQRAHMQTIGVNWFDKENNFKLNENPDYFCSTISELETCIEELKRRRT